MTCERSFHLFLLWSVCELTPYARHSLCPQLPMMQLTEAGTSGANGPCAAASVRGSGVGDATRRRRDTAARCARGTARPPRTAQTDCALRVRPFSLLGTITTIIIIISHHPRHHVHAQSITSMFKQEVRFKYRPSHCGLTQTPGA